MSIYALWMLCKATRGKGEAYAHKQAAKSGVIFVLALLGLTPVLKTLTEAISTDTIVLWLVALTALNLCFHGYGEERLRPPHPLALNAAVSGAVMLASRLQTVSQAFGLLGAAVLWLALFPGARNAVAMWRYPGSHRAVTGGLCLVTSATLAYIGGQFMWQYLGGTLLVLFAFPAWFHRMQRYKNTIHGPWDEAKPPTLQH